MLKLLHFFKDNSDSGSDESPQLMNISKANSEVINIESQKPNNQQDEMDSGGDEELNNSSVAVDGLWFYFL